MKHQALILSVALGAAALAGCTTPAAPVASLPGTAPAGTPAQPAGGHGREAFMGSYDINRDGVVTRAEYESVRLQRYNAADTNGDGKLSEAEYVAEFEGRLKQQYAQQKREPDADYQRSMRQAHVRFGILDRNHDGFISLDEEKAIMERTFVGQDTNGDGQVDARDPLPRRDVNASAN
ncbi:EF-hand domain-containing protein [Herbaspirillum sp. YR522]|uniref:EF-hand domain-containing protein n=1 Tax=Herbaspirillum sp. YR522 TaxID=1144342 RepID=UPI00026F88DF|nr:hypothetical protein [Herbaspirillum sp. YR522]EJM96294.1 hypothetical protein PMI40_04693 [Herbaspirillum sp. YR522]